MGCLGFGLDDLTFGCLGALLGVSMELCVEKCFEAGLLGNPCFLTDRELGCSFWSRWPRGWQLWDEPESLILAQSERWRHA